jgi:hypothetical protein
VAPSKKPMAGRETKPENEGEKKNVMLSEAEASLPLK